jgi:hypothetical protein
MICTVYNTYKSKPYINLYPYHVPSSSLTNIIFQSGWYFLNIVYYICTKYENIKKKLISQKCVNEGQYEN